jgi:hypothetical protein
MTQTPSLYQGPVNPNTGFLCLSVYWQPNPDAPNPEMPGNRLSMSLYLPVQEDAPCLCESGKPYGKCCRRLPYWRPVTIDPDDEEFSLYASRMAEFRRVEFDTVKEKLSADSRLHHTIDEKDSCFWIYWGDPPVESKYGIICFGDLDLQQDTLVVTALSEVRMKTLLDLLREHFGDTLPQREITVDPILAIDKRTGKQIFLPSHGKPKIPAGRKHRK